METDAPQGGQPIAIVGIGCRFPGIDSAESFWRVLRTGLETVGDYTGGRFALIDSVYAGPEVATRRGGFLPRLDRFDHEFFGISAREAELLDPQQRLLLETAWEALEDAGIPAGKVAGRPVGVFAGVWTSDYEACARDLGRWADFYATTGTGRYAASGRLSYVFDLRGPSLTVDTACSSSLVALHMAAKSIAGGECEMALAGGANVILRPDVTLAYSRSGMLSPDGRSKFGDAAADGYVRSEGAGMLVLKPLANALASGDRIYAIIRGSAVANDGRSNGMMIAPSPEGQEATLRAALRDAGVSAADIDYVEAHGTGTLVGDPIEIGTIGKVMAHPDRKRPCAIGSVKTNIGHTESAAGVAGVIKVALSLENATLPATLHVNAPNPEIAWSALPVALQTACTCWPGDMGSRLAGVSGFGITGTNAHIVMKNGPARVFSPDEEDSVRLFALSAEAPAALQARVRSWVDRMEADPAWPPSLTDLAWTAGCRRTHHRQRLAVTARNRGELAETLAAWLQGEQPAAVQVGQTTERRHRVAFIFPGQGGQWAGMCHRLYRDVPVFRERLRECDAAIRNYAGWSVIEKLEQAAPLDGIDVIQPSLFAVMVALAALWREWGVMPEAVVGHSMGESAAAAVCGALSLDDAARVICARSRLMKTMSGRGLMAVAELTAEEAAGFAAEYQGRISVAAENSPNSAVLSGDTDAIEDAILRLEARGVFCRRVNVDVASHCAHMDPLQQELQHALIDIAPRASTIPFYSTVTAHVESGETLDAGYWSRNLREPVCFSPALTRMLADGFDTFLEINAHPLLVSSVETGIRHSGKDALVTASLRRNSDERENLLAAAGALHANGRTISFETLQPRGVCISLPPYPWQGERHWIEPAESPVAIPAVAPVAGTEEPVYKTCVFRPQWKAIEAPPQAKADPAGLWILLGDSDSAAGRLGRFLERVGAPYALVGDVAGAIKMLVAAGPVCRGIVCDASASGGDPRTALPVLSRVTALVQALESEGGSAPLRLWLLTAGTWPVGVTEQPPAAAQGTVWGLARVIAREHPELRCAMVDLGNGDDLELEMTARLVCRDGVEDQLAVRGEAVYAARFERAAALPIPAEKPLRSDATYLITGGMGGVGLLVAQSLVKRGAQYLALVGRRQPSEEAREQIRRMEEAGAVVHTFTGDDSDDSQLAAVLAEIAEGMPPLRGILHLAAVAEDSLITNLSMESLERVLRPKAMGAWALHRLTHDLPLDFFILFSSLGATVSQPGQAGYAAANAYLDALAACRRSEGLPGLSIQWGPWPHTELLLHEGAQRSMRAWAEQGIGAVPVDESLSILGGLMEQGGDALVLAIAWDRLVQNVGGYLPRSFAELVSRPPSIAASGEKIAEMLYSAAPGRERRFIMEKYLKKCLAAVLRTSASRIDPAAPLGNMGVDSLMALELVRRLAQDTGIKLKVTTVFNHPTVERLGDELAARMGVPLTEERPPEGGASEPAGIAVEASADEALRILMAGGTHE